MAEDIHKYGSEEIFKKYVKFKENIDVDNDSELKWCPKPGCTKYVRKKGYFTSVETCECGQKVCMKCGASEHPNVGCSNVGDKELQKWIAT